MIYIKQSFNITDYIIYGYKNFLILCSVATITRSLSATCYAEITHHVGQSREATRGANKGGTEVGATVHDVETWLTGRRGVKRHIRVPIHQAATVCALR